MLLETSFKKFIYVIIEKLQDFSCYEKIQLFSNVNENKSSFSFDLFNFSILSTNVLSPSKISVISVKHFKASGKPSKPSRGLGNFKLGINGFGSWPKNFDLYYFLLDFLNN